MFNIFLRPDAETLAQLNRIETIVLAIQGKVATMALDFTRIQQEITENNDAITSAVALINRIAEELRAAAGNQDAINALADQLDAQSNTLAAAVVANTPAEPNPAPEA